MYSPYGADKEPILIEPGLSVHYPNRCVCMAERDCSFGGVINRGGIKIMRKIVSAAAVVGVCLAFTSAQAAEMNPKDKAVFDMLSPELQEKAKARLTDGNTVRGVLETMLLNEISKLFATNRIDAVDFEDGVAIVEKADGEVDTVYFTTATLMIKK